MPVHRKQCPPNCPGFIASHQVAGALAKLIFQSGVDLTELDIVLSVQHKECDCSTCVSPSGTATLRAVGVMARAAEDALAGDVQMTTPDEMLGTPS